VTIRNGLFVEAGATFVLGSEEVPGDNGTFSAGVHATDAANVQLHFVTINRGIDIHGGSGPFGGPFGVTWNTIEDSRINGSERLGESERERARRSGWQRVRHQYDPRQPELQRQLAGSAGRRLEGSPNQVTGPKTGQCANL
jgi:hypothetical protein